MGKPTDKEVYQEIIEEINQIHKVRLSSDDVHNIVQHYINYVRYCIEHITSVRLPYIGKFVVKIHKWQKFLYKKKLLELGVREETIKNNIENKEYYNSPIVLEYDKIIRAEWERTSSESTGSSTT